MYNHVISICIFKHSYFGVVMKTYICVTFSVYSNHDSWSVHVVSNKVPRSYYYLHILYELAA